MKRLSNHWMAGLGTRVGEVKGTHTRGSAPVKKYIDEMRKSSHSESATYFYYLGVKSLFRNYRLAAKRCFKRAKCKGYDDGAGGKKLAEHLENLT